MMKTGLLVLFLLAASAALAQKAAAPTRAAKAGTEAPEQIQKRLETYLRNLFAWGPEFLVKVSLPATSFVPEFYEVSVEVTYGNQSDTGTVYVSRDGRYLLRGELHDTSMDPFAAARSKIRTEGKPSIGPENAAVTVVEFSDFQCPHCRELHKILQQVKPNYPQVRFVYKDFPLEQIHPWAMTAAIAADCAFQQNNESFWKLHNAIFDDQEAIKPENAWQKILDFAAQAGLDVNTLKACMISPGAKQSVQESQAEGRNLKIGNTPTVFVNGRRLMAPDRSQLEQYIRYELARATPPAAAQKP